MSKAPALKAEPTRLARLNFRTTEKLRRQLALLAKRDRRTLSGYIEAVLEDHIAEATGDRKKRR
jgi:predicted HicB family RNase H-like nuclease